MYSGLFLFQAALQMALFFWLWRLWRERGVVVAAVLLLPQFGLVWDNLIVGAGRFIGLGPVLEALSWPRFWLHWLSGVWLVAASGAILRHAGFAFMQPTRAMLMFCAATMALMLYDLPHFWTDSLHPVCEFDLVRYSTAVGPGTFCFPDQQVVTGSPPFASIVTCLVVIMAGALSYYVGALLDFWALTMIDASIERVLIFSYPAMVVLFTSVRDRAPPSRRVLLAVALTYLGIFFTMGGFDLAEVRANLIGALLVLGSAFTYAIYFVLSERYTREIGSAPFTLYAMSAAAFCLAVHFWLTRDAGAELAAISPAAWALLLAIGVVCMFIPASLQAEGVRRIGAQRGAVLSTVGPPTTVVLAWALLGERLNGWQWLGIALIVAGILALDLARAAGRGATSTEASPAER